MSTWKFVDWSGRQYDDPAVGLVQPGDTIEADSPPDWQYWCLVPATTVAAPSLPEPVVEDVKEDEAPVQKGAVTEEDAPSEVEQEKGEN